MIKPVVISGIHPHYIDGKSLLFSKGNNVFKAEINALSTAKKEGYYNAGVVKNFAAKIPLTKRILRLGFHKLKPFNNGFIAIQHGVIVFKAKDEDTFKKVFTDFRGTRPLDLFIHPHLHKIYFGEYFSNNKRDEVYIYSSADLKVWEKVWVFRKGEIRHVHGLIWDEFRQGIWVLTGDSNSESGLWFTDNNFATLECIISGSQKTRAVEIVPVKDGLLVPMDSPSEKNYINFFDTKTKEFIPLVELPGSAFHACCIDGIFFVSTVTEPSEVNTYDYATVWASLNGLSWKQLSKFKRDWIPVKHQYISRYSEIFFPEGNNLTNYIIGYGQAIAKKDGCMLLWDKKDIIDYLLK